MSSVIALTGALEGYGTTTFRFRGTTGLRAVAIVDEPILAIITVPAATTLQVLGGTLPIFPSLATVSFLALYAVGAVTLAFQSADIGSAGLDLAAEAFHIQTGAAVTELRIRNAAADAVEVEILLGGV